MRFEDLIAKVQQAEQALEKKERLTAVQWQRLKRQWTAGWTPARIVVAGLVSGFMVGRARPLRVASGGGVLQMVTALSGLFASSSAQAAAEGAEQAADLAAHGAGVSPMAAIPAERLDGDFP